MRERFVVPAASLYVRPGADLDALALVETLGIGWHAVRRSDAQPAQFALVVGAGPVGLAVGLALLQRRARVVITDVSEARLAVAAASLAVEALTAGDGLSERLRELAGGELPSLVFDVTGNRQSMESSLPLVGFSGSLVLVGHTTGPLTFDNPSCIGARSRSSPRATPAPTTGRSCCRSSRPAPSTPPPGSAGAPPWTSCPSTSASGDGRPVRC